MTRRSAPDRDDAGVELCAGEWAGSAPLDDEPEQPEILATVDPAAPTGDLDLEPLVIREVMDPLDAVGCRDDGEACAEGVRDRPRRY